MNQTVPSIYPGVPALDDLELVRLGLLPRTLLSLPPATVVDAEGAPVADVSANGELSWLGDRSDRPYERWHLRDVTMEHPAALVSDSSALKDVPDGVRTLLVLASTDGDDSAQDIALVRSARLEADQRGWSMRIIPLGAQAPDWGDKVVMIAEALAAYGEIVNLTSADLSRDVPGRQGLVILLTGLSGSGKSTIARALRNRIIEDHGALVTLLDGDVVRRHLSAGLGFSVQDRETNVERIGWVAAEIARHGGVVIASPIAPFERTRAQVARFVEGRGARFVLIHVATPLDECERRDRKGLYARARLGEIPDFTGISSPYEDPAEPTLRLDTTGADLDDQVEQILDVIDVADRHPHLQENA